MIDFDTNVKVEEISRELQDMEIMETYSKTFEISTLLREMEKERQRIKRILYLLDENEQVDLPRITTNETR